MKQKQRNLNRYEKGLVADILQEAVGGGFDPKKYPDLAMSVFAGDRKEIVAMFAKIIAESKLKPQAAAIRKPTKKKKARSDQFLPGAMTGEG